MNIFKNRMVIGVLCIVLSLLICFVLTPLFNQSISQRTQIVRVVKAIDVGAQITQEMVKTVEVGAYNLPQNVIQKQEAVVGMYTLAALSAGDYILDTKVSKAPATENARLYHLDGSKQAISITIKSFATGLSGKLQSGDIVSVIAPDYKKQGVTVIPPELKYMEVISVTAATGEDANTGGQAENKEEGELPATVTLLAAPEQSKLLAGLEAEGTVHLSLVYRGTEANVQKLLTVQSEILEGIYPTPVEEAEENSQEVLAPEEAQGTEKLPDSEAAGDGEER